MGRIEPWAIVGAILPKVLGELILFKVHIVVVGIVWVIFLTACAAVLMALF